MKVPSTIPAANAGKLGMAALALVIAPLACAQQEAPYWYGGISAGQGSVDMSSSRITPPLRVMGYTTTSIYDDDDAAAFKVVAGYRFNRNFAIEGNIFDLGDYGFQAAMNPSSNLAGNFRPMGLGLDLVGFLPLAKSNALFGRVGLNHTRMRESFSARGLPAHPFAKSDDTEFDFKLGVGIQHDFSRRLAMRVEFERYPLDESINLFGNANLVSLGLVYRFGQDSDAAVPRLTPVAAASPPAPPSIAAPIAPLPPSPPAPIPSAPKKVTVSADSTFAFDSATIKPEAKAGLDTLAIELMLVNYDLITVVGHSDRIGAAKYNQALSYRRALAVKDYLASKAGIQASQITAKGVDGSDPVTRPGDCTMTARPALILCLQPDRRVEVEVVGTALRK